MSLVLAGMLARFSTCNRPPQVRIFLGVGPRWFWKGANLRNACSWTGLIQQWLTMPVSLLNTQDSNQLLLTVMGMLNESRNCIYWVLFPPLWLETCIRTCILREEMMVPEIVDRCKKHQDTSSNGESCNLGHPWALFFFGQSAAKPLGSHPWQEGSCHPHLPNRSRAQGTIGHPSIPQQHFPGIWKYLISYPLASLVSWKTGS